MPLIEIRVPDIGDMKDVTVIELLAKPGSTIAQEQSLVTEVDSVHQHIESIGARLWNGHHPAFKGNVELQSSGPSSERLGTMTRRANIHEGSPILINEDKLNLHRPSRFGNFALDFEANRQWR